jgi:hypothetical protein
LPNLIGAYIKESEKSSEHPSSAYRGQRMVELSPIFYEAAWHLCRRGVLRPGIKKAGEQATADRASGNGYCLTMIGRRWIAQDAFGILLIEPDRLSQIFQKLSELLGSGFLQRATEAARCHAFGAYIGCCAMCGAAAESILLAVAIAKSRDEASVLAKYRSASGRRTVVEGVAGQARQGIAEPFRSATGLLAYWRDEAAHGVASTISEIEAHEALSRLLRFAQFATENWGELTGADRV